MKASDHLCEGCSADEQEVGPIKPYVVAIVTSPSEIGTAPKYNLCDTCVERLRKRADPTQWFEFEPG